MTCNPEKCYRESENISRRCEMFPSITELVSALYKNTLLSQILYLIQWVLTQESIRQRYNSHIKGPTDHVSHTHTFMHIYINSNLKDGLHEHTLFQFLHKIS